MFTRIIIRLRWASTVLCVLSTLALTTTPWFMAMASAPIGLLDGRVRVWICCGLVNFEWSHQYWSSDPLLSFNAMNRAAIVWGFQSMGDSSGQWQINVPLWTIAAPLSALAFAGFRAKSRLPAPGSCRACRYPLQGASTCPECGRSATST